MPDPRHADELAARRRAVRGLLLGLVVGDAVGDAHGTVPPGAAPLRNSVAAQLACVTTEGLIRAAVRQHGKGICHPPSVVWHALVRWAYGQGIDAPGLYDTWRSGHGDWPDVWLAEVPLLHKRRGNAPATATPAAGRPDGYPATGLEPDAVDAFRAALDKLGR